MAKRLKPALANSSQWQVAAWLLAGSLFWVFLTAPYIVEAKECVWPGKSVVPDARPRVENGRMECLKPVAQKLRRDSILAVYATATVATLIAFQLRARNGNNIDNGGNASSRGTTGHPKGNQDETGPGQT